MYSNNHNIFTHGHGGTDCQTAVALIFLMLKPIYSRKTVLYHGCCCPGSLFCHVIISYNIDYIDYIDPTKSTKMVKSFLSRMNVVKKTVSVTKCPVGPKTNIPYTAALSKAFPSVMRTIIVLICFVVVRKYVISTHPLGLVTSMVWGLFKISEKELNRI